MTETVRLPDRRLKLAFFGTPEIAATHLRALIDADDDDVALVVSQPDRPRGRGRALEPTPVKAVAQAAGLEVLQPTKLKDGKLARRLLDAEIDLAVVVAYGRILPTDLFRAPAFDTWNVHASILPRHRGAAPIQHAILEGDPEAGVTLMLVSEGMDEGDMLLVRSAPVEPDETSGALFSRLAALGAEALLEGLRGAKGPGLPRTPQDPGAATYAPLLTKADGRLDPAAPAEVLARRVRGLHPWPGAFLDTSEGRLKVHRARPVSERPVAPETAGDPVATADGRLLLPTPDGALELLEVQAPGKKAMSAAAYLRGRR